MMGGARKHKKPLNRRIIIYYAANKIQRPLAGGLNNYQYVSNPMGWLDPFGLSSAL